MAYAIEILGVDKVSLLQAGAMRINRGADHRNNCSFTLITTAGGYLPQVGQDIKVKNGATVLFGGIINTIAKQKLEVGTGADKVIEVSISSDGYSGIPQRRTPSWMFNEQTCGYIVTKLVTDILADEGITADTISTGITLTEYDTSTRNAKEILDDMATTSAYKWYIDDAKALHFIDEDTEVNAAHDIVEGGAFTDFSNVSVEESLDNYRNKQFVVGGIGDDGYQVTDVVEDSTEISARQTVEGGSGYSTGVYGNILEDSSIDVEADATAAANDALKQYGIIPQVLKFSSRTLDWDAGTKLKANLPTFGIAVDSYYLIEEVSLEDEDGKNLVCRISATARKSASFSTKRSQSGVDYFSNLVKAAKSGLGNESITTNGVIDQNESTGVVIIKMWTGTAAEYAALTPSSNTLYYVKE